MQRVRRNRVYRLSVKIWHKILRTVFGFYVLPRDIEYAFVLKNLDLEKGKRILDVGCTGSRFPLTLASLGYETYGVDIREYEYRYPNFSFFREDIRRTSFPNDFFHRITAVSTIEHIGLSGRYDSYEDPDADKKAVEEMKRILRRDGKILITVPYGKGKIIRPWQRIYDRDSLKGLLDGLVIEKQEYYIPVGFDLVHGWMPTSEVRAGKVDCTKTHFALALLKLAKR